MTLVGLVVTLLFVGFVLWLVSLAPINETVRKMIYGVVIFAVVLWLLQSFGLVKSLDMPLVR